MAADGMDDQGAEPREVQAAARIRTFLKGMVYFDNRRASAECTIRDLSDTGARLLFASPVSVPHEPRRAVDAEMGERVAKLESDVAAMMRLLRKIEAKVFPNGS